MAIKDSGYDYGRVGVLMGGPSSEREISLKSGKAVYEALRAAGLDAVAIDLKTGDLKKAAKIIRGKGIDVAFIALHGRFGEDGQVQRVLEDLDLPYTGSGVLASWLSLDKILSRQVFKIYNLDVPSSQVYYRRGLDKKRVLKECPRFPVVVKPATHGSSIGLSIVDNKKDLLRALDSAFALDECVLVEKYISGREVTVGILGNTALPVVEIIPAGEFFDYEAKYKSGDTRYVVPAKLNQKDRQKVQEAALRAYRALGCCGFGRVDIILSAGKPFILEINSIPGFTPTSLLPKAAGAAGIEFVRLCERLLKLAYEKKEDRLTR